MKKGMVTMRKKGRMAMRNNGALLMLLAVLLSGCDFFAGPDFSRERADKTYRAAMDDYRAGRLQQAVDGLRKVCETDPSNSSARFQLACLLQDFAGDHFAAACEYREYLQQQPNSEKAKFARDRYAVCEKEFAKSFATKYGLDSVGGLKNELEETARARAAAEEKGVKLEKDIARLKHEITVLKAENDRLRKVFDDAGEENDDIRRDAKEAVQRLKAEKNEEEPSVGVESIAEAKKLLEDEEEDGTAPIAQPADAKAKREAAEQAKKTAEAARAAERAKVPPIPDFYIVQDGDTLYKIAVRFYGRASAWRRIRDANKALISTDGRVKTGQKLVLPK